MGSVMRLIALFLKDQSGATAIEYGLIAAGISVAIIAVVQGLGTKLTSTFTSVSTALNSTSLPRTSAAYAVKAQPTNASAGCFFARSR